MKIITAAKQTIAEAWKTITLVTVEVKNRVTQMMIHEQLEATLQDKNSKYQKVWEPWLQNFFPTNIDHTLLTPLSPCPLHRNTGINRENAHGLQPSPLTTLPPLKPHPLSPCTH